MKLSKTLLSVLVLALAGMMFVGCDKKAGDKTGDRNNGSCCDTAKPTKPTKTPKDNNFTIKVGSVGHDHQIALYIACLQGENFKKYGTWLKKIKDKKIYDIMQNGAKLGRIELVKAKGGSYMTNAMATGQFEVGLGGVAAVALQADKGSPFKIICPLQTDGDMLVMSDKSPIKTWDEFVKAAKENKKPIKIGFKAPNAVAKIVFVKALKEAKITFSEKSNERKMVHLVNLGGGKKMNPALKSGIVDGYVMNQPAVAAATVGKKKIGHVVAELRDLAPAEFTKNHPCCCVCATDSVIKKHPQALKALVKLIILGSNYINEDKMRAAEEIAGKNWTKKPVEVEKASLPTIGYFGEFTKPWIKGMESWYTMMREQGRFKGEKSKFKGMSPEEFVKALCDMTFANQAAAELKIKPTGAPASCGSGCGCGS